MNILRRTTNHSNEHVKHAHPFRLSAFQVLAVIGILVASFALSSFSIPGFPSVSKVAARGGSGGGGQPPIVLPADWPASVPIPAGALQQAIGASPHWVLFLVADGGYSDVMQANRDLYLSHGFVEPDPATAPYFFENAQYKVSMVGAARDHSPTKTNVYIYLDVK